MNDEKEYKIIIDKLERIECKNKPYVRLLFFLSDTFLDWSNRLYNQAVSSNKLDFLPKSRNLQQSKSYVNNFNLSVENSNLKMQVKYLEGENIMLRENLESLKKERVNE